MSENIQKSPSLNQMVEALTHLKQRLEYFERHIQNSKNQEVRKKYFQTLALVIEQKMPFTILLKCLIMISESEIRIPDSMYVVVIILYLIYIIYFFLP